MSKDQELIERVLDRLVAQKVHGELVLDESDSELVQELEDSLENDDFVSHYRAQRLQQLQQNLANTRSTIREDEDLGYLTWFLNEDKLMKLAAQSPRLAIHFCQSSFRTCQVLNRKLEVLAQNHPLTKFVAIEAGNCPFLTKKLGIQVLPCIVCYKNGLETSRMVGLLQVGYLEKTGDIDMARLEQFFIGSQVITPRVKTSSFVTKTKKDEKDEEEEEEDDFFD